MYKYTASTAVGRIKPWEVVIDKGVITGLVLSWLVVGISGWLVPPPLKKRNHETNKWIWPFISCVLLVISSENGKILLMVNVLLIVAEYQHCLPQEWKLHWGHLFPSWDFWWCRLWIPAAVWPCMSFKARLRFCVTHYFSLAIFNLELQNKICRLRSRPRRCWSFKDKWINQ